MPETLPSANPFALMMDPESVFQAIERSERLARLKSRICRPLDKPLPQGDGQDGDATAEDAGATLESIEDFGRSL